MGAGLVSSGPAAHLRHRNWGVTVTRAMREAVVVQDERHGERCGPRLLWRNRDFMLLWAGQAVSRVGSRASAFALPLLILALTGSAAQAGFVGALGSIPALVLSLPAGALVDRWDRKRLMIGCELGRALLLLSIPLALWLGVLVPPQIYAIALAEGALSVFFGVAQTAALPRVVPRGQLGTAVAQNEALFPIGDLFGPPLGGVLYNAIGRAAPFIADAFSYLCSAVALGFVRTSLQHERDTAPRRLHAEIAEGLGWLWKQPLVRTLALLSGGSFFVDAGVPLAALVLARLLGASAAAIGLLFAIAALGGLIAFAVVGPLTRRVCLERLLPALIAGQAVTVALLALISDIRMLGIMLGFNYLFFALYNSVEVGYRLSLIPDELQGRVNSAFQMIALSSYPIGAAASGLLLERLGIGATLLVFGAWMGLLTAGAFVSRALRPT